MDPKNQKEMERLRAVLPEVDEEIALATEEDAIFEEIERAKGAVAGFIAKYDALMKRLGPEDQKELMRTIGLKVEEIEENLTRLREAPE